jgi:hypothetical protein
MTCQHFAGKSHEEQQAEYVKVNKRKKVTKKGPKKNL